MYEELVKRLRNISNSDSNIKSNYIGLTMIQAADAIEELLRAAKKMHLWIFLHSCDEQAVYDACGLSDEMNAALGYSGQFELRAEPPKEET